MAHTAILTLECENNKEFNVIECDYEFGKNINDMGMPCSKLQTGIINITIVSPDDSELGFYRWAKNDNEHRDGKIVFSVVNAGTESNKTLLFERAYCIHIREYFNTLDGETQMLTTLTVSAAEIAFGKEGEERIKNN